MILLGKILLDKRQPQKNAVNIWYKPVKDKNKYAPKKEKTNELPEVLR